MHFCIHLRRRTTDTNNNDQNTTGRTQTTTTVTQKQERQHEQEQKKQEEQKQGFHKMTRRDVENDLEKEKYNQQSKDDWVENSINIIVPSFIRLFVIRRIIDKYIKNNKDKKNVQKEEIIKKLASVFEDDKKIESLVTNIVTRLINDGIKKYMSKYYNEKQEANIIEDIFNKIILEKFSQEYNQVIKYGTNNEITNSNYYQHLLFNSSDLMNQIFQYLEWGQYFEGDLVECSLVNSHWLYHAWNVNCMYFIDFSILVAREFNDKNRKWTRIWQRLYNGKCIKINLNVENSKVGIFAMNKLSMFRKVEKVNVYVYGYGADVNKSISAMISTMSGWKDRIKYCQIKIDPDDFDSSDFEAISPLRLPKA